MFKECIEQLFPCGGVHSFGPCDHAVEVECGAVEIRKIYDGCAGDRHVGFV
jgi:hypothetical protein